MKYSYSYNGLLHSPVSSHHCRVSHQHGFRVCRLISAWCYVFVYCKCHWANVCRLSYTCERFHTHWVLRCSLPLPLKMMFLRFSHVDTKRFISFSYYRYPVHNNFINYFSILLLINFEFVSFFSTEKWCWEYSFIYASHFVLIFFILEVYDEILSYLLAFPASNSCHNSSVMSSSQIFSSQSHVPSLF